MDLKIILLVVIVILILYFLWNLLFTSVKMLMSFQKGLAINKIDASKVSKNGTSNYSFSVWTYIDDWAVNNGQFKNILAITKNNVGDNPYLFYLALDRTMNNLLVYAQPFTQGTPGPFYPPTCTISNFPIQAWVNISISVYNRAIDVYLDGKLVKTCSLTNAATPITPDAQIVIGGNQVQSGTDPVGFSGYIASVLYNPNIITPQEAWNIYARGYSGSLFGNFFNRYQLQFAFLKDNEVMKSFNI